MTEKERLKYIKEELEAIVKELSPRLNELLFIKGCLDEFVLISDGKIPDEFC